MRADRPLESRRPGCSRRSWRSLGAPGVPLLVCLALLGSVAPAGSAARPPLNINQLERAERADGFGRENLIKILEVNYIAHDGLTRRAYVLLPRWYGPGDDPPIPLIISPHGRGIQALQNASLWGNLPAVGRFAVVCPEGQGRRLTLFAWGDPGDIADLARMPTIVSRALPFIHINPRRVYAFGSSMGGQETLLLLARDPRLLAGAAAFDADTNLAARYRLIVEIPDGRSLRRKLVAEVGGTPSTDPQAYRVRSPQFDASRIARSGVPLQIWWSMKDRIVRNQVDESGLLYRSIRRLDPSAPVVQVVGTWTHSVEFSATRRLAIALSAFSLLPVHTGLALDRAAKRALGLPSDWTGPPLAIHWRE
jgi:pimeloyl-ACP methyl ester carboxylesterase